METEGNAYDRAIVDDPDAARAVREMCERTGNDGSGLVNVMAGEFSVAEERLPGQALEMPWWWPKHKPAERLRGDTMYKGTDGKWRDGNGVLMSRKERRKAGLR